LVTLPASSNVMTIANGTETARPVAGIGPKGPSLVPAHVPSMTAPLDDDTRAVAVTFESLDAVTHASAHSRISAVVVKVAPRGTSRTAAPSAKWSMKAS
jgi:hypothetical protein